MDEMDDLAIKAQLNEISNKIDSIIQKINDLEPEQTEKSEDDDSRQEKK
jgi:hypothetical protein